jgi:hypothetical protein
MGALATPPALCLLLSPKASTFRSVCGFLSRLQDGRVFPHASRKCGRFCFDHFTVHIDDAILIIMFLLRLLDSRLKFNQDFCSHGLVVSYAFPV